MIYLIFVCMILGMLSKGKVRYISNKNAPDPKDIVAITDEIKMKQQKKENNI